MITMHARKIVEDEIDAALARDLAATLPLEADPLANDTAFYLECMNNLPLKDRKTRQEIRNGLILFWNVYKHIKPDPIENTRSKTRRSRKP